MRESEINATSSKIKQEKLYPKKNLTNPQKERGESRNPKNKRFQISFTKQTEFGLILLVTNHNPDQEMGAGAQNQEKLSKTQNFFYQI